MTIILSLNLRNQIPMLGRQLRFQDWIDESDVVQASHLREFQAMFHLRLRHYFKLRLAQRFFLQCEEKIVQTLYSCLSLRVGQPQFCRL